jgi:biopolymer transport protein ExbB
MKRVTLLAAVLAAAVFFGVSTERTYAQAPAGGPPTVAADDGPGPYVEQEGAPQRRVQTTSFWYVLGSSGWFGVLIWIALFATAGGAVYFSVDSIITLKPQRIMPPALVDNVTRAMKEGDVLKALESCEHEPGALSNVLTAGFSHVEEGFEVIQDAIGTAADLEIEKMMQKLNWISIMAALSPMLGLLGTVQGMILAFANISTGAPDIGFLAMAIAQALYTTAAGLVTAIPALAVFYQLRNSTNKTVLRMEAMTMEMIKDLRNVEVVES